MLVLFFVGRPLYFMELALGQFSSAGCVNVWDMIPALGGVGYGQASINIALSWVTGDNLYTNKLAGQILTLFLDGQVGGTPEATEIFTFIKGIFPDRTDS